LLPEAIDSTNLTCDRKVPRRRDFKVVGGNLVASNPVTKKTVFSIDLRKVTAVNDENADRSAPSRMPRSFRLVFDDGEDILFWTDNDEEKAGW
jgi:serine/arginine repetitive matrix protein 2